MLFKRHLEKRNTRRLSFAGRTEFIKLILKKVMCIVSRNFGMNSKEYRKSKKSLAVLQRTSAPKPFVETARQSLIVMLLRQEESASNVLLCFVVYSQCFGKGHLCREFSFDRSSHLYRKRSVSAARGPC